MKNSPRISRRKGGKAENKIAKVMHEFKEGKLKSSSGEKVTDRQQAIAIGLSEARTIDPKYQMSKKWSGGEMAGGGNINGFFSNDGKTFINVAVGKSSPNRKGEVIKIEERGGIKWATVKFRDFQEDIRFEDNSMKNRATVSPRKTRRMAKKGGVLTNQFVFSRGHVLDDWASDIGGSNMSKDNVVEYDGKTYIISTDSEEGNVLHPNKKASEYEYEQKKGGSMAKGRETKPQKIKDEFEIIMQKRGGKDQILSYVKYSETTDIDEAMKIAERLNKGYRAEEAIMYGDPYSGKWKSSGGSMTRGGEARGNLSDYYAIAQKSKTIKNLTDIDKSDADYPQFTFRTKDDNYKSVVKVFYEKHSNTIVMDYDGRDKDISIDGFGKFVDVSGGSMETGGGVPVSRLEKGNKYKYLHEKNTIIEYVKPSEYTKDEYIFKDKNGSWIAIKEDEFPTSISEIKSSGGSMATGGGIKPYHLQSGNRYKYLHGKGTVEYLAPSQFTKGDFLFRDENGKPLVISEGELSESIAEIKSSGGSKATRDGAGDSSNKALFEITVPKGKESLLSDDNEYDFTSLISHALTKKWHGHGAFDVRLKNKVSDRTSEFIITVPRGKESLLSDDNEYDFTQFISKTLTKKWFGHGAFDVELQKKLSSGSSMKKGGQAKMLREKSFYQAIPVYKGFKWAGFWDGYHHFTAKEDKGYTETRATDQDIDDGNLKDMIDLGVTKHNGGGAGTPENLVEKLKDKYGAQIQDMGITEIFIDPFGEVHITSEHDIDPSWAEAIEKDARAMSGSLAENVSSNGSQNVATLISFADSNSKLVEEKAGIMNMADEMKWNSERLHQQFKRIFSYMAETSYNKENPESKIELTEAERHEFADVLSSQAVPESTNPPVNQSTNSPNVKGAIQKLNDANAKLNEAESHADSAEDTIGEAKQNVERAVDDLEGNKLPFKNAGQIPNNYDGKTPEQVWNDWNKIQRAHFIADHRQDIGFLKQETQYAKHYMDWTNEDYKKFVKDIEKWTQLNYIQLPTDLTIVINEHVNKGQYAGGGKATDLPIGTIYKLKNGAIYTVISHRTVIDTSLSYESDAKGSPIKGRRIISSNSWLGETPEVIGKIELDSVTKNIGGHTYTYYLSGNKTVDTEMSHFDARWKAFAEHAGKKLRAKYDEQEEHNNHYANAKMVNDWFNDHKHNGGSTKELNEGDNVYVIELEQPFENWYGTLVKVGEKFSDVENEDGKIITVRNLEISKSDSLRTGGSTMVSGGGADEEKFPKQYSSMSSSQRAIDKYELKHGKQRFSINELDKDVFEVSLHTKKSSIGSAQSTNQPITQSTKIRMTPKKKKQQETIKKLERALAGHKMSAKAEAKLEKQLQEYKADFDRRVPVYERMMESKGKFFIEIPAEYRLKMNTLLHGTDLKPRMNELEGKLRITVDNKAKLNRLYKIYSDMLTKKKQPVPSLEDISGSPKKVKAQR